MLRSSLPASTITTSRRLSRRSTSARSSPRPPSASATTWTCLSGPPSASRSSAARRLLPLPGRPHSTTSGILPAAPAPPPC
ncbi:hypothetical protein llap_15465 [Limosa lapponica baueri]|uniref:Uncharacterized protein n=1 Tax=Limosa lapponica baueri TaxID=1758121 RepID=A0A2I0TK95_LIMLA|nr:hypothetical protein llap_15465 [Limosa lapponica baueri]